MRETFIQSLISKAEKNPHIWLMTADLGYSVVEQFEKKFPDRFVNVGVAEQNMVSMAAGIASLGNTVFVYSIINFLVFRALEQIRLDVCYHNFDVKLIGIGTGYSYGSMGYTHHAIEDLSALKNMPHLRIYSPADPVETLISMDHMLREKGPCYLRLDKSKSSTLHDKPIANCNIPLVIQEGHDVAFISTGSSLKDVLKAKTHLETSGVSVCVVSCPLIKPMSTESLKQIISHVKLVISVEPHGKGGLSSIIYEILAGSSFKPRFYPVHYPETPFSICGTEEELKKLAGADAKSLSDLALKLYQEQLNFSL